MLVESAHDKGALPCCCATSSNRHLALHARYTLHCCMRTVLILFPTPPFLLQAGQEEEGGGGRRGGGCSGRAWCVALLQQLPERPAGIAEGLHGCLRTCSHVVPWAVWVVSSLLTCSAFVPFCRGPRALAAPGPRRRAAHRHQAAAGPLTLVLAFGGCLIVCGLARCFPSPHPLPQHLRRVTAV